MAQISYSDRTIHCKIVYYGPSFSGKSTSIRFLQSQIPSSQQINIAPEVIQGVPTVSFTYLTDENISGLRLKLTLATFQGTSAKLPHWKQLLSDVDGIVFVADSQRARLSENASSAEFLELLFQEQKRDLTPLPIVFQYNKSDLPDVFSTQNFARQLLMDVPDRSFLSTVAIQGLNVLEVLKLLIAKILERLRESFQEPGSTEAGGLPGIDLAKPPKKPSFEMLAPLPEEKSSMAWGVEFEKPELPEPPIPPVSLAKPSPGGAPPPRPQPPVTKAPPPSGPGAPPPTGAPVPYGYGAPPVHAAPASAAALPPAPIQPAPMQPPKAPAVYKAMPPTAGGLPPATTPPANIPKPTSLRAAEEKPTEKAKKKAAPKKEAPPQPKTEVSFGRADEPWPPPPPPPPPEPPSGMFAPPAKDQEQSLRRSGAKPTDPYQLPADKAKEIAADEIASLDDGLFDSKMADIEDTRKRGKKEKREETKRDQAEILDKTEAAAEAADGFAAFAEPLEDLDEGGAGAIPMEEDRGAPPVGGEVLREVATDLTLEPSFGGKAGEEEKKQVVSGKGGAVEPLPEEELLKARMVVSRPASGVRLETASTERQALQAKSARGNPLVFLLKIVALPILVPAYLVMAFWKLAERQSERFDSRLTRWVTQLTLIFSGTATHELHELPWFEKLLSGDAGKPGPLERFVAHSRWLMWTLQKTIGTKFILISNLMDIFIEFFASWIHSIFQAWQVSRTMAKAAKRKFSQTEIQSLCDELSESRDLLSRLFHFSDYEIPSNTPASFPLEVVLEARGVLSEMKRDLAMLTERQMAQFLKESAIDRLKAALPNPFDLVPSLKDFVLLAFFMRYSRQDIEQMYIEMLISYQRMIQLKANSANVALNQLDLSLLRHEAHLLPLVHPSLKSEPNLEHAIETTRKKIQRIIQALCKPDAYFSSQRWSRVDLIREVAKSERGQKVNPLFESELDFWFMGEVEKTLKEKGVPIDFDEAILRKQDRKALRKTLRTQRKQSNKFIAQESVLS